MKRANSKKQTALAKIKARLATARGPDHDDKTESLGKDFLRKLAMQHFKKALKNVGKQQRQDRTAQRASAGDAAGGGGPAAGLQPKEGEVQLKFSLCRNVVALWSGMLRLDARSVSGYHFQKMRCYYKCC